MKLSVATFVSLFLFASASAQTNQAGTKPTMSVQDPQTIVITRSGSQPVGQAGPAPQMMRDLAPKLADLTDNVLFGDVWERPGLSKRDRSLATVAALIAMNRPDQLRSHLARAREME